MSAQERIQGVSSGSANPNTSPAVPKLNTSQTAIFGYLKGHPKGATVEELINSKVAPAISNRHGMSKNLRYLEGVGLARRVEIIKQRAGGASAADKWFANKSKKGKVADKREPKKKVGDVVVAGDEKEVKETLPEDIGSSRRKPRAQRENNPISATERIQGASPTSTREQAQTVQLRELSKHSLGVAQTWAEIISRIGNRQSGLVFAWESFRNTVKPRSTTTNNTGLVLQELSFHQPMQWIIDQMTRELALGNEPRVDQDSLQLLHQKVDAFITSDSAVETFLIPFYPEPADIQFLRILIFKTANCRLVPGRSIFTLDDPKEDLDAIPGEIARIVDFSLQGTGISAGEIANGVRKQLRFPEN